MRAGRFRTFIALAALAAATGFAVFWLLTIPQGISVNALGPHAPDLANGRTMFIAGGCASCHAAPKQEDHSKLGGGLALNSSFGTFYAPNISPDSRDGIGGWSEAQFVNAMIRGVSPSGEHLYPAFPYTSYQHMRIDDVRDLFAYLKTLPPVAGKVRGHDLPFPFNIRRGLGLWKLMYLDGEPFRPNAAHTAEWNRGAYLVNGPAHCAECHSPRNVFGAIITDKRFTGGPSPNLQGSVPNITQFSLGAWSQADFASMLETGMTPDDRVGGSMTDVVRNTAQLSAQDRMAIAAYLKSLPPVEGIAQEKSR